MVEDEVKTVQEEFQVLAGLKKALEKPWEEEEILQTKIVSPYEVQQNWKDWEEAAKEEIRSLLEEKEALEEVSKEGFEEMKMRLEKEGRKIEVIPSKVVFTRKPGPRGGKPKVRWVVCGNFEARKPEEENFSSGADATTFRLMIHLAAQHQWEGTTVDVKTAFLNADWDGEEETTILIKPPPILTEAKALPQGAYYLPRKAAYGFRRSPRLWGDHRDRIMEELEIGSEEDEDEKVLVMKPMESEPNLWRVLEKDQDLRASPKLLGLVMTYVDDMFIVGHKRIVTRVTEALRSCWKTSQPEEVEGARPVRFLGMDVVKKKNEETGYDEWMVRQTSYVKDMLARGEVKERRIPITREQASDLSQPEETPDAQEVREAQKVVGELLWTLTRTRPDLMLSMSRLCSHTLKAPVKVKEISDQVKGYLKKTSDEGLKFKKDEDQEAKTMRVYTDASFAPDGGESHGCVVVKVGSSLLAWKSGRQSLVTLSTAEAELLEVVEGFALGEATAVLVEEAETEVLRMGFTDSQAALAIMTGEGGSWRTRHLRMRAMYARQLIQKGVWTLQHIAGERMLADLGTKALTASRMTMLKEELGMVSQGEEEEKGEEKVEEEKRSFSQDPGGDVQRILRLVAILVQIQGAKGQGRPVEIGTVEYMVVAILIVIGTLTVYTKVVVVDGTSEDVRPTTGRRTRRWRR